MLEMLAQVDPLAAVMAGVWLFAAGMFPLGIMLGATCSPCCPGGGGGGGDGGGGGGGGGGCAADTAVPGCTNPDSPNYNPDATCDDGSCETCCNQGKCVVDDPDCNAGCNSLSAENGCNVNNTAEEGPCVDCCDSYCQDGCDNPPPGVSGDAPLDCSPTFATTYFVGPNGSCDCQEITYYNCYDCDYVPPP